MVDAVVYCILLLNLGAEWWRSGGFFGEGILVAELKVQGKSPRFERGVFRQCFNPGGPDRSMSGGVMEISTRPRTKASGHVQVNFATLRNDVPTLVTNLMNSLLRSLGHGVKRTELMKEVEAMLKTFDIPFN